MKYFNSARALLLLVFVSPQLLANAVLEQSFTLQPGWNAVFLTVAPDDGVADTSDDAEPERVFGSIAGLQQVWAWIEPDTSVQYVQDANDIGFNDPGWYGYLPPSAGPHASVVTNLFKVLGARPYLIKIDPAVQSTAQTWSVSGVPVNRIVRWVPDNFTLTGFAVDPALEVGETPTFGEFLAIPATSNPMIFSLNADGSWGSLSKLSPVQSGRAYWVRNDGSFNASGPLAIDQASASGIDFLDRVASRSLVATNQSTQALPLSISVSDNFPLFYFAGEPADEGASGWLPLSQLAPTLAPGQGRSVKLGLDRRSLSAASSALVTLRGGKSVMHIPVAAEPPQSAHGLYVGEVTIGAVSEANEDDPLTPTPVVSLLSFKLLLHFAADGQLRLLKTVYMMAQKGQPRPVSGVTPMGQSVLVTDESRLADFTTTQQAGGVGQGYRLSSPVFDFPEPHKVLNCDSGDAIVAAGHCSLTLTIAADSPTHPMRHQYHPAHDGKLPNGQPESASLQVHKREIWPITRHLQFQFLAADGDDLFVPLNRVEGVFTETIEGMHKQPIHLRGRFQLERVSSIDELNPAVSEPLLSEVLP